MGKVAFEPEDKTTDERPLYERVAEQASLEPDVALRALVALRELGYTIGTPRVQWR
jgi:hypothetical protein